MLLRFGNSVCLVVDLYIVMLFYFQFIYKTSSIVQHTLYILFKIFYNFEEIWIHKLTSISQKRHHSGKVNTQLIGWKLITTNHVNPVFTKLNLENTCTFKNPLHWLDMNLITHSENWHYFFLLCFSLRRYSHEEIGFTEWGLMLKSCFVTPS